MRGKNSILMCLAIALLSAPLVVNFSFAPTLPEMYVSPETTISSSGQYFTITIYLKDAVEVAAWEFKITWDLDLTEFPPVTTEGLFLKPAPTYFKEVPSILYKNVLVGCFMTEPGNKTGNGSLASITFKVRDDNSGSSVLNIYDTKLFDSYGNQYDHIATDGSFYTTNPKVIFSWTPAAPIPGQVVTFDGTASYDPDGGEILYYLWDFGDGSDPDDTGPVVTHTYANYRNEPYHVSLTVMDDDYEVWYLVKDLRIWRDLQIVTIWPSIDWQDSTNYDVFHGQLNPYDAYPDYDILVTVVNLGTIRETYDIVLYADLDTSVIGDEISFADQGYTHALNPDTGSGWALYYLWDIRYPSQFPTSQTWGLGPELRDPGLYTLTAVLTCPGDQDLSNNILQQQVYIHARAEPQAVTVGTRNLKLKHSTSVTFSGKVQNKEATSWNIDGVWARLAFDIINPMGEVTTLRTAAVYLLNGESSNKMYATLEGLSLADVGTWEVVAYSEFGWDGTHYPFMGLEPKTISFDILP